MYVDNFIKDKNEIIDNSNINEPPNYVKKILIIEKSKKILFFHNDPLNMNGSRSIKERLFLIKN